MKPRVVLFGLVLASSSFADIPPETKGDSSSNSLQQEIDAGDISQSKASTEIQDENFDKSEGGLYCPDNECDNDPDDASNGF
ncbi:hypothetical protein [Legionella sp. km772]|uniref:hypothetical protein n=1 Tax=Legionella sp. km772 TaxID=2498111 RepID=UPI000F8F2286|nr:hypothetical protein [Legionella sp. km772]RUR05886.1 hypothetical protein ELY15_13800 [Legionella sp. km772]